MRTTGTVTAIGNRGVAVTLDDGRTVPASLGRALTESGHAVGMGERVIVMVDGGRAGAVIVYRAAPGEPIELHAARDGNALRARLIAAGLLRPAPPPDEPTPAIRIDRPTLTIGDDDGQH